MKSALISLTVILIGLVFWHPAVADGQNDKTKVNVDTIIMAIDEANRREDPLKADLLITLRSFAEQHSVTETEVWELLDRMVLDGKAMRKGGVGIIDNNNYIILDGKRNALILAERKWEGKQATEQEVVIIDGNDVPDNLQNVDLSKVAIVMFSPHEVRFISLAGMHAGKYDRLMNK